MSCRRSGPRVPAFGPRASIPSLLSFRVGTGTGGGRLSCARALSVGRSVLWFRTRELSARRRPARGGVGARIMAGGDASGAPAPMSRNAWSGLHTTRTGRAFSFSRRARSFRRVFSFSFHSSLSRSWSSFERRGTAGAECGGESGVGDAIGAGVVDGGEVESTICLGLGPEV